MVVLTDLIETLHEFSVKFSKLFLTSGSWSPVKPENRAIFLKRNGLILTSFELCYFVNTLLLPKFECALV